jgi:hypothetical protein
VTHGGTADNLFTLYKIDGDTFTKIPGPTVMPPGSYNRGKFSPNGNYLTIVSPSSPYVTIYKVEPPV